MKRILFVLQVLAGALMFVGLGQLIGEIIVFEALGESAPPDLALSFWEAWGTLTVGALALILTYVAEFIYDAGRNSVREEKED